MSAATLAALHSAEGSLVLECVPGAPPLWRHFGARLDPGALPPLAESRTAASYSLDQDMPFALLPAAGLGWFGPLFAAVRRAGRGVVIVPQAVDVAMGAADIVVTARDDLAGVAIEQRIAREPGGGFAFSATLRNTGDSALTLDRLVSALVPLPGGCDRLVSWRGRHNAELVECCEPLPAHGWRREGRRGISGHGGPPALLALGEGATWHGGLVLAAQLAWSGNSVLAVERDDEGFWTLALAAALEPGEVVLAPGASWTAPPALIALSTHGRNGASAIHHAAVRARVRWPGGAMRPRPVHLNSWEACYFDHDAARIGALAEAAAALGIERFVLDDGWFAGRAHDRAGLGDWHADPAKYPRGLAPLARKVNDLGMEFGLWVEPEMVNPDSALYRAHPEWALALDGRERPAARHQLVLDLARDEVRDHLFGALAALLREVPIGYLKWDHNRDLVPAGGAAQVHGVYALFERLRAAFPALEIEGCAGGGGRSDAGLAAHVHRFWASDNIDAVSRVPLQRGFLAFLPPELMGSHVGASPAHATGRSQALGFRAAVALPGHFGVELDPRRLDPRDQAALAEWIAFYKAWRGLLHAPDAGVWLGEGADGLLWQAQGRQTGAAGEWLLFAIRVPAPRDRRPQPVALPFLAEAARVRIRLLRIAGGERGYPAASAPLFAAMADSGVDFTGSWLAAAGLPLPPLKGESVAIFHLKAAA